MSDEVAKIELDSPDLAAEKLAAFQDLFPGVIADGVLDAGRLGELLDTEVAAPADGRERFGLMWAGKQEAVRSLLAPSRGALLPEFDKSTNFDEARHTFIEGDNLEALKLLQKAYNDKIKLIYIDPPYNTGSNDFIYPDDFSDTLRAYLEYSGQLDKQGNRKSSGADTAGRRHSRWLSMMYPRLVLARNLLTQDGVIFISIDDNEVANLRALMDEIFGPENFITSFIWEKRTTRENRRAFSISHDYLLCYARDKTMFEAIRGLLPITAEVEDRYSNPDNDYRGVWQSVSLNAQAGHATKSQFYELTTPGGRKLWPPKGRCWTVTAPRLEELIEDGRIWFGADGTNVPRLKHFLSESRQGLTPHTLWRADEVGTNDAAKKELLERVEFSSSESVFDTPKPTKLIRHLLALATKPDTGDLVLDFFAGSGSAADGVLQQNAADGGNRRFIMVQLPEPTGYDDYPLVSDITRARIASAAEDVAPDAGIRSFRLSESCFRDATTADPQDLFDLRESTLDDGDHVMEELAGEVLLKEGVALDAEWARDKADLAEVILADGVAVVLSLEITEAVASAAIALKPRVLVFLEDGFAGRDAVKTNAFTNAKNLGITVKTV
ncbi:site-specific DNA-methyltransferase [Kineosporia sp. A_224]|uniref:site-specific DNA-methyltransferase n=1 Tax=Kineosporia sp. A_224 TaxID=1962180 RepID=UPI000B4BCCB7|nr:site-specific DNA-methyltransferase [Kineosporia sp. A_224]